MPLIKIDDGKVLLNGEDIPGLISNISVSSSIRFDNQDIDGKSSKRKVPLGFSDADITIQLELLTDDNGCTCYEKLANLDLIFRSKEKNNIKIFDIDNKHLNSRNVRKVVFSNFESSESNSDDIIYVTISFVEYEPAITKTETIKTLNSINKVQVNNYINPEPNKNLMVDIL